MDAADPAREELVAKYAAARAAGDVTAMAEAALALPTSQRFGVHPGQLPALLHEAFERVDEPQLRGRLAAALARCWAYGGDATRARRFADQAQQLAAVSGSPDAMAEALDAALLAHWGPDDFPARLSLAARLDEVAAHLTDPERRMGAHLWRLTTAWECLDMVAVHRQLRALDLVADEIGSPRAQFFATSRRAMHALATSDLAAADQLIARTATIGAATDEPDVDAVMHELRATRALMVDDVAGLRDEAEAHEAFGTAEGIASISADAAVLWLAAGDRDRAARLAGGVVSAGVSAIPRDVDFLLTITCLAWVASATGLDDIARSCGDALLPYAGRAVLNAGAVVFRGVVDDYIHRVRWSLGDDDAVQWRHAAAVAYERIGARWWHDRLEQQAPTPAPLFPPRVLSFRQADDGSWIVGELRATATLPDRRGMHYLRDLLERPGVDIDASTMAAAAAGHAGATFVEADVGERLDAPAIAAYRTRLIELDSLLDAADATRDQQAAVAVGSERDALLHELRRASGLGGRRRVSGASSERARVAVRKAIASALTIIDERDPAVARLLRDSIRTGTSCRYDSNPAQSVTWITRST